MSNVGGVGGIDRDDRALERALLSAPRSRRARADGFFDAPYDPLRHRLRGYGFYTRLAKNGGNWLWETAQNWRSPGFEVNDLVVLDRADYKWMNANVGRQWTMPTSWYRNAAY